MSITLTYYFFQQDCFSGMPIAKFQTADAKPPARADSGDVDAGLRRAIELLFFAYRDFTAEPDAILSAYGFGRAHHRAIYFIGRHPGISVSELLEILKITKQSLARVLRQLIDEGFVEQRSDTADRRRRMLFLRAKGRRLEHELTSRQARRIERAMAAAGADAEDGFCRVLRGIINEDERHRVAGDIVGRA